MQRLPLLLFLPAALTAAAPLGEADRAAAAAVMAHFDRATSLVSAVVAEQPTRARLDWAAWDRNPLFLQRSSQKLTAPFPQPDPIALTFDGLLVPGTVVDTIAEAPLADLQPLAPGLLCDWLTKRNYEQATSMLTIVSTVSQATWGNIFDGIPLQEITAFYLRDLEGVLSLWARVDFQPNVDFVKGVTDGDGDGFAEMYAQVSGTHVPIEVLQEVRDVYLKTWLSDEELKTFFFELASAWYPTHNTTLVPADQIRPWPTEATEEPIRAALGETRFEAPAAVMRAEPTEGHVYYRVFLVHADPAEAPPPPEPPAPPEAERRGPGGRGPGGPGAGPGGGPPGGPPRERPGRPRDEGAFSLIAAEPAPAEANLARWRAELAAHGSWDAWAAALGDYRSFIRKQLDSRPERIKALFALDGSLFFRGSLEYLLAGDLRQQAEERDPFPAILDYQQQLAARNIDMLLVVIPSKPEVYPRLAGPLPDGETIAQPFTRKLLLELGEAGVEAVDLLPAFVAAAERDAEAPEPFYMVQDTHWSNAGAREAAHLIAERVKQYAWFGEACPTPVAYTTRTATFRRLGDLRGMLPDAEKLQFPPMELSAEQVVEPDGSLYDDDPSSPILLLGDSFCGVFQYEDCGHAGLSAHLARELGLPIDLIMAQGSGPKIRAQLLQRGPGALEGKKLVIWTVVARDLWQYWSPWAKVPLP